MPADNTTPRPPLEELEAKAPSLRAAEKVAAAFEDALVQQAAAIIEAVYEPVRHADFKRGYDAGSDMLRDALAIRTRELSDAEALIRQQQAELEGMPRTADGVIVKVGMRVWTKLERDEPEFPGWIVTGIGPSEYPLEGGPRYDWVRTNGNGYLTTQAVYSTHSAAEQARGGEAE